MCHVKEMPRTRRAEDRGRYDFATRRHPHRHASSRRMAGPHTCYTDWPTEVDSGRCGAGVIVVQHQQAVLIRICKMSSSPPAGRAGGPQGALEGGDPVPLWPVSDDGNRDGNLGRRRRSQMNVCGRPTSSNRPLPRAPSQLESESPDRVRGFESLRFRRSWA